MENITFYEQISLFLENKSQGNPQLVYAGRTHRPTHAIRVSKTYERQVFYIKD